MGIRHRASAPFLPTFGLISLPGSVRRIPSPTHGWIFRLYRDGVVFYLSIVRAYFFHPYLVCFAHVYVPVISLLNVLLPVISVRFVCLISTPRAHSV